MHNISGLYGLFITLSLVGCTSNRDCPLTETCVGQICQEPCRIKNPCAAHAVCINSNHGTDCICEQGYHGNGFSACALGKNFSSENGFEII